MPKPRLTLAPEAMVVFIIFIGWVIAACAAILGGWTAAPPPAWFDAWSKLIGGVVLAAIGVRVLWVVPKQVQTFLRELEMIRRATDRTR
jgi:putative Mn2+ efflux pump MntP